MVDAVIEDAVARLRQQGAVFAFLHGSQLSGTATPESGLDIAAFFADPVPAAFELDLPPGTDMMVLNTAPLELCGRIALEGELVLDDDQPARVHWVAQTRKIYADEKYRIDRSHAEFLAAVRSGR
jgi:predicted nucleotidyltransferase